MPKTTFRKAELDPYESEYTLTIDASKGHWIFNWNLDDDNQHLDIWLETWSNEDMKAVLKHIATGKGREAERWIKSNYNSWLKTRRPTPSSTDSRRTVAELCELAESAALERRKHKAKARKKRETERERQREARLRQVMATAKTHWKAADIQANRGVASGYDRVVSILTELAEGYTLTSSRAAFERDLQNFLAPHSRRRALLRRLARVKFWME